MDGKTEAQKIDRKTDAQKMDRKTDTQKMDRKTEARKMDRMNEHQENPVNNCLKLISPQLVSCRKDFFPSRGIRGYFCARQGGGP